MVLGLCWWFNDRLGCSPIDYALLGRRQMFPPKFRPEEKICLADREETRYPDGTFEFEHFNMLWDHAVGIDNGSYGRIMASYILEITEPWIPIGRLGSD
jgi:hypothetical protein